MAGVGAGLGAEVVVGAFVGWLSYRWDRGPYASDRTRIVAAIVRLLDYD
ncbi:MAG: hypothetical protein WA880_06675 [Ornithinimicrobium sp.]